MSGGNLLDPEVGIYLGDGVYAKFDGFQFWLTTASHDNEPLVALEPLTLRALVAAALEINRYAGRQHFTLPVPKEEDSK